MKQHRGFTLIELSIVILIIAILTMGVMKGGSMIEAAKLGTARGYTTSSIVPTLSGLTAWYETSLKESLKPGETPDGSQITTWYDISPTSISGQKNPLTRSASSAVVLERVGINKLPSISFNGGGILSLSAFYQGNISTSNTFFAVFRPAIANSTAKILFDSYNGGRTTGLRSDRVGLWDEGAAAYVYTETSTNPIVITGGADYILTTNYNNSSSKVFQNLVETLAGNSNLNLTSNNEAQGLTVGGNVAHSSDSQTFTGLVSEIIIYDRILQVAERREVIKYLSKKYNIAVSDI